MIPKIWSATHINLPNRPKNENIKKMKRKPPGDIIILHMCTKNYD